MTVCNKPLASVKITIAVNNSKLQVSSTWPEDSDTTVATQSFQKNFTKQFLAALARFAASYRSVHPGLS